MKTIVFNIILVCMALGLYGCDNDENGKNVANQQVQATLLAKYPAATNIKWLMKREYLVADFRSPEAAAVNMLDHTAWFDKSGKWYMTEIEIPFVSLPEAVKTAFQASEYATWRVEDVDKLEREGVETVYVIEVENKAGGIETEVDLYYSPDGVLIKTVIDSGKDYDYHDYIPSTAPGSIAELIEQKYPGARIVDIERENGMIEVEIIDGNRKKDVYFNIANEWVKTEWEVRVSELPAAVTTAIANSQYASYRIDDADYVQTPAVEYYLIELEKGNSEVKLRITETGTIL